MDSPSPRKRRFFSPQASATQLNVHADLREEAETDKRIGTLYDAVAGRISNDTRFIPAPPFVSRTRDTASSSTLPAAPENVLFRRKRAPERYEESDSYFAHESLSSAQLPESDLVKALHCYASDFYSRATPKDCIHDWSSMDETALLALGILMEEVSQESLGETGDMVFVEGEIDDLDSRPGTASEPVRSGRDESVVAKSRRRKRRRLDTPDTIDYQG